MPAAPLPMLAQAAKRVPTGDDWAFEFKWDGVRAIARWDGHALTLHSRLGRDITPRYPELQALGETLGPRRVILDGEVVVLDEQARPSFHLLQRRMHVADRHRVRQLSRALPAVLMIFDLLWLDGESLMDQPYDQRRERLLALELGGAHWQVPPNQVGHGRAMLHAVADAGMEGVIAKRRDSVYVPAARSAAWRKVRAALRQEFVVGGWTPGKGARRGGLGALLLGYHEQGRLRYAGLVGTGFDEAEQKRLMAMLNRIERDSSPFAEDVPRPDARFVEPTLVTEVRFTQWTPDHILRHPVYLGLRDDKDPRTVIRET